MSTSLFSNIDKNVYLPGYQVESPVSDTISMESIEIFTSAAILTAEAAQCAVAISKIKTMGIALESLESDLDENSKIAVKYALDMYSAESTSLEAEDDGILKRMYLTIRRVFFKVLAWISDNVGKLVLTLRKFARASLAKLSPLSKVAADAQVPYKYHTTLPELDSEYVDLYNYIATQDDNYENGKTFNLGSRTYKFVIDEAKGVATLESDTRELPMKEGLLVKVNEYPKSLNVLYNKVFEGIEQNAATARKIKTDRFGADNDADADTLDFMKTLYVNVQLKKDFMAMVSKHMLKELDFLANAAKAAVSDYNSAKNKGGK